MRHHPSSAGNVGPVVAVYGAAGHTGRFVIRELARRGHPAVAIGRDAATLATADFPAGVRRDVAALDNPAALARALAGVAAVVNCAGPFLDTADALVAAAVRARVHYLDVTAEQASAQAVFDRHAAAATSETRPRPRRSRRTRPGARRRRSASRSRSVSTARCGGRPPAGATSTP